MRPNLHRHFSSNSPANRESEAVDYNLAAQVSDIAKRISRLNRIVGSESHNSLPTVDGAMLRKMLTARRARAKFFNEGLFADPAWDMLLDLLMAQLDGQRVTVSNLCVASAVPSTTALRWIKTMESDGLLSRRADPLDGRRYFVELTKNANDALKRYFDAIDLEFVI